MSSNFTAVEATGPRELSYVQVPFRACGPTELLVKIESASICNGSEKNMYLGHPRYTYPFFFGHEPFGTVVEAGSAASGFKVGDCVSWWFSVGAFAKYCYVDTALVGITALEGDFNREAASLLELATATARALWASGARPEHRTLIIGLGPSGLLLTQQLQLAGVDNVEGWDVIGARREKGLALGLASAFDPAATPGALTQHVQNRTYDLIFDCFGDDARSEQDTVAQAVTALRPGGTLIKYGHPNVPRVLDEAENQRKNIQVIEPAVPLWVVQTLIEEQATAFLDGRLDLETLISHVIGFEDIETTLEDQIRHPERYLKAVVKM